jgi:signal transduction histidine kinase/DNA-binding response OmpR family regulator
MTSEGRRKAAGEAAAPSAIDFRLLFESAPGLYLVLTPSFEIIGASDAYLRATMTQRESLLGKHIFEAFPDNPDDPAASGVRKLHESLKSVLDSRRPDTMAVQKYDIRRPESEGSEFEERFWSPVNTPVFDTNGGLIYIIHRVEDVTEFIRAKQAGEKTTEDLLSRSERMESEIYLRAQQLAESNRQLTAANRELALLYDRISHLMAQADDELRVGGGHDEPQPAAAISLEEMLERVGNLITGHKRLEEELRQSQKMEAVGQLAGGIAHDFNNVLNVIIGYSQLLLAQLAKDDPAHGRVEEIRKAGERAATLTQQLLAFSRKQVLHPRVVNLGDTLREIDHMLRRMIGEHIEVTATIDPHLAQVKIDPIQVQQLLMNLVVNARDAMPGGGKLTFELMNQEMDESAGRLHIIPAGRYVMLSVSDNGSGMTPEVRRHVFEPFFTTKEIGLGTGLGLATVYGIVRQSGGHIWLYSEPGIGTTFKIFFPLVDEPRDRGAVELRPKIGRGSETILLVEDDPALRALAQQVLSAAGYRVLTAEDGNAALLASEQHNGPIHLLLTDVVMPQMGGKEIASRLAVPRPGMKVLFMSGYTGNALAQQGTLDEAVGFIQKPWTPEGLCQKIRAVLSAPSSIHRILVVDDEPGMRNWLSEVLEIAGYRVFTAGNGREARSRAEEHEVDLVITDLVMPEEEGIEMIRTLRKGSVKLKIIAMTGSDSPDILSAARILGAQATLLKPLTAETVLGCVANLQAAPY